MINYLNLFITMALVFWLTACGSVNTSDVVCNNNVLEGAEECDQGQLNNKSCIDFGFDAGQLGCSPECTFDTSACQNITFACGDGIVADDEECDQDQLDGWTCQELGFEGGQLGCNQECRLNAGACSGCLADGYEENDELTSAAELQPGEHNLSLCNTDREEDWFQIDLSGSEELLAVIESAQLIVDLDLELLDQNHAVLAFSSNSAGPEILAYQAEQDLTVFIRIFSFLQRPGAADYSLNLIKNPDCQSRDQCSEDQVCSNYQCIDFVCNQNNPCPGPDALLCDAGACVECISSDDCLDANVFSCDQGSCIFSCQDDVFEPNSIDSPAEITLDFTQSNLTLCGQTEQDWYQVSLLSLTKYQLDLTFAQEDGDIDVFVYPADNPQLAYTFSSSLDDNENLTFAIGSDQAGDYLIQVLSDFLDYGQSYQMSLANLGQVECAWDDDCSESDQMCIDFSCQIPGCLEDSDCDNDHVCQDYDCIQRPAGDLCSSAIPIDTNNLPFSAENIVIDGFRNQIEFAAQDCTPLGTPGKDVLYQIDLSAGQLLSVALTSDFDAAITIVSDCSVQAAPAETCLAGKDVSFNGYEEAFYQAAQDQTVYIVVDSYAPGHPQSGSYTLIVDLL
jgi:hypothetical protein